MDSTLAAGWIAFWGAVAGAVVGGGLAALASWSTTRGQWKRERTFRQRERLADLFSQGTRSLADQAPRNEDGQWVTDLREEAVRNLHFARVLAVGVSPHLALLMTEIFLDERAEWRTYIPSTDVRVMNGIVARWLPDPDDFDRAQKSLDKHRAEFPWQAAKEPADQVTSLALRVMSWIRGS
jgi:hypothetical protein